MKVSQLLASSSILVALLFTGCCSTFCEPKIVTETIYIKQDIPPLPLRPQFSEYQFEKIEFNSKEFYIIDKVNAGILGANWFETEAYTKHLEATIQSIQDGNSSQPTK